MTAARRPPPSAGLRHPAASGPPPSIHPGRGPVEAGGPVQPVERCPSPGGPRSGPSPARAGPGRPPGATPRRTPASAAPSRDEPRSRPVRSAGRGLRRPSARAVEPAGPAPGLRPDLAPGGGRGGAPGSTRGRPAPRGRGSERCRTSRAEPPTGPAPALRGQGGARRGRDAPDRRARRRCAAPRGGFGCRGAWGGDADTPAIGGCDVERRRGRETRSGFRDRAGPVGVSVRDGRRLSVPLDAGAGRPRSGRG